MTVWTMPTLIREIESTRRNFDMASREVAAGNSRLRGNREQWAIKLDTLEYERQKLLQKGGNDY